MMKNKELNTLTQIGDVLKESSSILIFPHGSIDGDALGSSVALCLGLRALGKKSYVMMDETIPDNIKFIENDCCCWDLNIYDKYDIAICIDNGEISRIYTRQDLFWKASRTMLIDHHKSSEAFLDHNYIDISAAACAEIVYDLLNELKVKINDAMAEAMYVGIVTDTGRFQYSNTTKRTHEIVAELMDYNIDQNKVSVEIYQTVSREKIMLESKIMHTLSIYGAGKIATAYMTMDMLKETGAKDEETEGVVEILRNLKGVEVAVFAKEKSLDEVKVSMRSKYDFDVSKVAQEFSGGGHIKAAGFSSEKNIEDVLEQVVGSIREKI